MNKNILKTFFESIRTAIFFASSRWSLSIVLPTSKSNTICGLWLPFFIVDLNLAVQSKTLPGREKKTLPRTTKQFQFVARRAFFENAGFVWFFSSKTFYWKVDIIFFEVLEEDFCYLTFENFFLAVIDLSSRMCSDANIEQLQMKTRDVPY